MLKSNNFNSLVDDLSAFSSPLNAEASRSTTVPLNSTPTTNTPSLAVLDELQTPNNNGNVDTNNSTKKLEINSETTSLAAQQLTCGVLQFYAPPIAKAKGQLKELIQKQNKIYIDLSAEKYKLDNADIAKLSEMMNSVKVYREKLLKIKKQMQTIYQRTKVLKKRAINIQTCKEKELQRKLQKQQQEESLIAKQP